jgi:hypothetical protein
MMEACFAQAGAETTRVDVESAIDTPPAGWDEFYRACSYVHPYQSSAFGRWESFRRNRVMYLSIAKCGMKVGQCLVSLSPHGIARWYFGPVLSDTAGFQFDDALAAVVRYLKNCGVVAIGHSLTPPAYGRSTAVPEPSVGVACHTLLIDLTQPVETLLKAFDRTVRKNVRKCRERQVQVRVSEGDGAALEAYVKLLAEHRKKLGLPMPPFYPNRDSVRCFAASSARLLVALASVDGQAMAGLGFAVLNKVAVEVGVAQSADYDALKLPLQDFIKAEACGALASAGVEVYDLAGVSLAARNRKEESIRRFKQKFSNRLSMYHSIDLRFKALRYYYCRAVAKVGRMFSSEYLF